MEESESLREYVEDCSKQYATSIGRRCEKDASFYSMKLEGFGVCLSEQIVLFTLAKTVTADELMFPSHRKIGANKCFIT